MYRGGRLLERYVIGAIVPYFLLALLLLTGILYAQQSVRLTELVVGLGVPADITYEIALGLLPGVLVFTLPVALLTGVMIGLSRLGTDSELIAMRAAGVGTWRLIYPVLLLGLILSGLAFYLNLVLA